MILSHFELDNPITVDPSVVNVIVVEDNKKFYQYCQELVELSEGGQGNFILTKNDKALSFSKEIKVIYDIFSMNFADKKAQNSLLVAVNQLVNDNFIKQYTRLTEQIFEFFQAINSQTDYSIEYDEEQNISAFLKAFGVRWQADYDSLLSKTVSYIQLFSKILKIKCFIFINLKCYLSEDDLFKLYKEAQLEDISLVLLENVCREKLTGEFITVIDKDLCEFVV